MKYLPLILLAFLVSCNDTLRSRSTIPHELTSTNELRSSAELKRGQILRTHINGSTLNPVHLNDDDSLVRHDVNKETIAVVLKIEGNKYYEYIETHDYEAGKVTKQVQLKFLPTLKSFKDETILSDNTVRQSGYNKTTLTPKSGVKVKFNQERVRTIDMDNFICNIDTETEETVVVLKDAKQVFTDFASVREETVCDGILNASEFASLNLSPIEFCDMTSEEQSCGQYNLNSLKNMKK